MTDTTVNGITYRIGRLDAFDQLEIARKLAPVIGAGLLSGPLQIAADPASPDQVSAEASAKTARRFITIMQAFSQLSRSEARELAQLCMTVCTRVSGSSISPVMNSEGRMMFQDIEMPELIQLSIAVIQENCGRFMRGAATDSTAAAPSPVGHATTST